MKKVLIGLPIVAAIVVVWIFYGRFAVEGGKGPWSMINNRPDVLKEALANGMSEKEKQAAFRRALGRQNMQGVRMLLAAGVKPKCDFAFAGWFGGVELVEALIGAGDNVKACDDGGNKIASDVILRGSSLSEDERIVILQRLAKEGVPLGPDALKTAESQKLPKIVAYLKDPNAAIVLHVQPLALVGAEPRLDDDALKVVCEGEGVASLPPYKLEPGKISPIFVVETLYEKPRAAGAILPKWWTSWYQLGHTQVVACARVVSKQPIKTCKFEGGSTMTYYDATFELSLREGKTAKQLASKSVALEVERVASCPMFKMGGKSEGVFPKYGAELEALAKPIVGAE